LAARVSRELLPYVTQPGQYVGREINQLPAEGDWEKAEVRIAVAFPDAYSIGMSHLGCQIIYWLANHLPGVCAERCYAPWGDAEAIMRSRRIPLFTWDTRQPVITSDILAVSLQYEMGLTNFLAILDLAGIPIYGKKRDDSQPLVLAGGPLADNPEAVAEFVDLLVIGDAEASLPALVDSYRQLKAGGVRRRDIIEIMARQFPWLYAPSCYTVAYHDNGTLAEVRAKTTGLPTQIERCRTADFEEAPFPLRPLVPYVQVVHDRMCVEIMRGCPQPCRFCHAGHTKRPVALRSVQKLLEIAEAQYRSTGHSELGLLSLSTADYPHLAELAARINERFAGRHVNISVPSLRVDKMLKDIPWMANSVRKGGLTIAVEAASDKLRRAIRKKVTDGDLIDGVIQAYRAGWRRIKCYFMVGFPGETEQDIKAIYDLCRDMSLARKSIGKGPGEITASISWLVPKPHTPLQWAAQRRWDYFDDARRLLRELQRADRLRTIRVKTHDPKRSLLEAVVSRGDRRLAPVIERAFRLGARFDAWEDCFRYDLWQQALAETGIDPDWYAHRERSYDELLPWDHIHAGPKRDYLQRQYDDVFAVLGQPKPAPGIISPSPPPAPHAPMTR
jgi:radical SAM family uncharacterized protein